jgi:hypothetical protein
MLQIKEPLASLAEDSFTGSPWESLPGHLLPFPRPLDWDREVAIIAKRGAGANYIQDGGMMRDKIKRLLHQMSWAELKKSDKYIAPELNPWRHL